MANRNVPDTEPTKANVPDTARRSVNVPDTKHSSSGHSSTKVEKVRPDEITRLERNPRRFVGQKLGVRHWDGSIHEIPDGTRDLAILKLDPEIPRILDRAPWSGLEIVEMT